MKTKNRIEQDKYTSAKKKVKRIKGFYRHLAIYLAVNICITIAYVGSDMWNDLPFETAIWNLQIFFVWIPWGIGLLIHGICALDVLSFFIGRGWEDKKIKKLMERDQRNSTMNWE